MRLWTPSKDIIRDRVQDIIDFLEPHKGQYLCDVATGSGLIPLKLMEHGHTIDCYDISDSRMLPDVQSIFKRQSAFDIDYSKYDIILCIGLFYHLDLFEQRKLVKLFEEKDILLDTHITQTEYPIFYNDKDGAAYGQLRKPTWSSKTDLPFVHGEFSLKHHMFDKWQFIRYEQSTPDRFTYFLKWKNNG